MVSGGLLNKQDFINKAFKTTSSFMNTVTTIAKQSDGKKIYGGSFINYNGQLGTSYLVRLNPDGSEDTSFSNNAVVSNNVNKFSTIIRSVVIQADGKILVGGNFTNYNAQTGRSYLIRLNSDGTEDTAFSTNAVVNGTTARLSANLFMIAVQSDNKILIGGSFTNYSAQTGKSRLIRLNSDGTEDTTFSTNGVVNGTTARFSAAINVVVIQPLDSKIIVGGNFLNYSAQTGRNYLIRLNTDGTEDTTFSTTAVVNGTTARFSAYVSCIAIQPASNKILIGGNFLNYSAQTGKDRLILLSSSGAEDTAFSTNAIVNGTTARFSSSITTAAFESNGKCYVGGSFVNYSAQTGKSYFIGLNSDGTENTTFNNNAVVNGSSPRFDSAVTYIYLEASSSDGYINSMIISGAFLNYYFSDYVTRLSNSGNYVTSYEGRFKTSGVINSITETKGRYLILGGFVYVRNALYNRYVCITNSGAIDNLLSRTFSGSTLNCSEVQSDGKILIGGDFTNFLSQLGKSRLIRLNFDGTEDTAFSTNAVVNGTVSRFSGSIQTIKVQPSDGKILVGGSYTNYSAQAGKNYVIRLNADGTEDTVFSAAAVVNGTTARFSGFPYSIIVQPNGQILVGGSFTNYNGETGKSYLIRLNADGSQDITFSANAVVNGTTARFSSAVYCMAYQPDGKLLIGGIFQNYSAQTGKNRLIRLNADGTEDTTFSSNAIVTGTTPKFSSTIRSIVVQPNGKILVGGVFQNYNAQTGKSFLIRLNADGTEDTAFSNNAVVISSSPRLATGVYSICLESSNNILVGGGFTGSPCKTLYICRFDPLGRPIS